MASKGDEYSRAVAIGFVATLKAAGEGYSPSDVMAISMVAGVRENKGMTYERMVQIGQRDHDARFESVAKKMSGDLTYRRSMEAAYEKIESGMTSFLSGNIKQHTQK
ncbi:MAG: hypothetical protein HY516_01095 [Candidatus Aenigmarchaeota archaeon]|nr:hypothetical protein [Candidatus Aenigmarchaeota archaeon]